MTSSNSNRNSCVPSLNVKWWLEGLMTLEKRSDNPSTIIVKESNDQHSSMTRIIKHTYDTQSLLPATFTCHYSILHHETHCDTSACSSRQFLSLIVIALPGIADISFDFSVSPTRTGTSGEVRTKFDGGWFEWLGTEYRSTRWIRQRGYRWDRLKRDLSQYRVRKMVRRNRITELTS